MKKLKTTKTKEIGLIVLALLIIAGCVAFLFGEELGLGKLFSEKTASQADNHIAVLEYKSNTVRQRQDGTVSWKNLKISDQLFLNDEVFTQDQSTGTIKFLNGSAIDLAPNTLIKLNGDNQNANIDLVSGFMLAKMSKDPASKGLGNINISAGGTQVSLGSAKDAEIQIQASEDSKQISLVKGTLELKVNGKKVELKKDQAIAVDKQGQYQIKNLEIRLISPERQKRIYYQVLSKVDFQWSSSKKPESYNLLIAEDSALQKLVRKELIAAETHSVSGIPEGSYFWSVTAQDPDTKKEIQSAVGNFSLLEDRAPKVISPLNGDVLSAIKQKSEKTPRVTLHWERVGVQAYQIQILNDKQQNITLKSLKPGNTTSANKLKVPLPNGNYKFRVKIQDPLRPNSPWGDWIQFAVKTIAAPQRPTNLYPGKNDQIQVGKNFDEPVEFRWEGDEQASHKIEIALDPQFQQVIFEKRVAGLSYAWRSRVFGDYFWRVGPAIESDSTPIPWSETHPLTLLASSPELLFPENNQKVVLYEPGPVDFRWQEVFWDNAEENKRKGNFYLIEASNNSQFESFLFQSQAFSAYYSWVDPQFGSVYWRSKAKPKRGEGVWSKVYQFDLQKSAPPAPPLLLPLMRLKIEFLPENVYHSSSQGRSPAATKSRDTFVKLTWPKIEYVKEYVLEVYRDKRLKNKIISLKVPTEEYLWKNPVPGLYYMRVAAIDKWEQQGDFSKLSKLSLNYSGNDLKRPRLLAPFHKATLPYEETTPPFKFSWEEQDYALFYRYQLAKDQNFLNPIYSLKVESDNVQIDAKTFNLNGPYYWRVLAYYQPKRFKSSLYRQVNFINNIPVEVKEQLTSQEEEEENDLLEDDIGQTIDELPEVKKSYSKFRSSEAKYLLFNYTPTSTSYEITGTEERTEALGATTDLNIVGINSEIFWGLKNSYFEGQLSYISGSIYQAGFDYQHRELGAFWGKIFSDSLTTNFGAAVGAYYTGLTELRRTVGTTVESSVVSYLAVGAKAFFDIYQTDSLSHQILGEVSFLDYFGGKLAYRIRYRPRVSSKLFYNLGILADYKSGITVDQTSTLALEGELSVLDMKAEIGFGYIF